eukprot:Em0009g1301a
MNEKADTTSTEEKRSAVEGRGNAYDSNLTMNGTKTEAVLIHENGEKQELTSNSFLRAQHTLRETEKLLSTVHCSSDHGKDTEGPKVVDRIKNYSPLKMTRSMSLRKKSRPTPPPPKPEVVSSGMTEEQIYLSQISCIKALKESLEEILQCIRDKDTTIVQLKHELAGMQDNTQQPVLFTQSPVLRRSSSRVSRRPQSCLDLISVDNKL